MLLHELQPKHPLKNKQPRAGQGGKRGNTSGRGQKGQKSRSGHRIRPAERDLIIRLPKLRGYRNKAISSKPQILKVSDLMEIKGDVVSQASLAESGLTNSANSPVKVLGDGEVTRPFKVAKDVKVSKSAIAKIVKAGGVVIGEQTK